jgi:hypothetical protein
LLLSPTVLACWAANFGACRGLSQALSWQGAFLIKGLGLAQGSIGLLGALPASASVVAVFAAGWQSQRLLARGVSSRVARGMLGGGCVALGGLALAVMPYVPGVAAKIALATIGIAVPSVINVIGQTVFSELTPVAQRGALLAFGTAIATSAGLLAPYIMGSVVETAATPLAGFNTGFMICAKCGNSAAPARDALHSGPSFVTLSIWLIGRRRICGVGNRIGLTQQQRFQQAVVPTAECRFRDSVDGPGLEHSPVLNDSKCHGSCQNRREASHGPPAGS